MLIGFQTVRGLNSLLLLIKFPIIIHTNMTQQEKYEAVQQTLQYMIAEGMVREVKPGQYRLKTERELEQEMLDVLVN